MPADFAKENGMSDLQVRRFLSTWAPLLAWAAIVWQLGGDSFSATQTSRVLGPLIDWLLPGLRPEDRQFLVGLLRLSAHPTVYGVQALLTWRAIRIQWPTLARGPLAGIVLVAGCGLAGADEIRQAISAVREGSATGFNLDLLGTLAVIAGLAAAERWRHRRFFSPGPGE
jgi:hypothetical protein